MAERCAEGCPVGHVSYFALVPTLSFALYDTSWIAMVLGCLALVPFVFMTATFLLLTLMLSSSSKAYYASDCLSQQPPPPPDSAKGNLCSASVNPNPEDTKAGDGSTGDGDEMSEAAKGEREREREKEVMEAGVKKI
eukprot:5056364-Pyramimonas_sp.AAC.2